MIDLDEIDAGARSPLYLAIAETYAVMLTQKTREVLQPQTAEQTAFIRGYVTAVNDCARIPAQLKSAILIKRTQNKRRAR